MAISVSQIFSPSPYSSQDERLISPTQIEAIFNPSTDYIEYVINTVNNSFQTVDYNYSAYSFPTDGTTTSNNISSIEIDPAVDLSNRGITSGDYNTYYNFYKNELLTNPINKGLFIKSISADRTELIVKYTSPSIDPVLTVSNFVNNTSFYFDDFYLNFGNNILSVANNIQVNPTTTDILINLNWDKDKISIAKQINKINPSGKKEIIIIFPEGGRITEEDIWWNTELPTA